MLPDPDSASTVSTSTAETGPVYVPQPTPRALGRRRRRDWRLGGRSVRRWGTALLAGSLISLGVGVVGGGITNRLFGGSYNGAGTLVLQATLFVVVVGALSRARPAGLLRIQPLDILWGISAGLALRGVQGVLTGANGIAFPVDSSIGAAGSTALASSIAVGIMTPVIEEFFFRGILLVSIFEALRRSVDATAAGVTAVLASSGFFVAVHAVYGALSLVDGVQLFAVGACCGLIVVLTGRIWGAVLTHIVYNVTFLALVTVSGILG